MSSVVPFRRKAHVVIHGGTIFGPAGHQHLGSYRYFVELVDEDGDQIGVWDGPSHAEAVAEAAEWEMPVVDRTTAMPRGTA